MPNTSSPRYQTIDPISFKKHWEANVRQSWLCTRYTTIDGRREPIERLVLTGPYRDVFAVVTGTWRIRNMDQGFDLEPIEVREV